MNFLSGGANYVQIFDHENAGIRMSVFEMGNNRTPLLGDHLTSTCLSKSQDLQKRQTVLKVLPSRDYLFRCDLILNIAGNGFSCSPITGIVVFVQPSCLDQGNCPGVLLCVSLKEGEMGDLIKCQYRCEMEEPWDYALVDLAACNVRADIAVDWHLCEIWLSNIW